MLRQWIQDGGKPAKFSQAVLSGVQLHPVFRPPSCLVELEGDVRQDRRGRAEGEGGGWNHPAQEKPRGQEVQGLVLLKIQ